MSRPCRTSPPRRGRPAGGIGALLLVVVLVSCQSAGDQLVDLPPDVASDTATDTATDAAADCDTSVPSPEVPDLHPSVDGYDAGVVRLDGEGLECAVDVAVRIADTPDERAHGLMEVPSLPDGVGMWFAGYTEDRTGGFYMKDTLVPLDIAYVDANGTIVDVLAMDPCEADPCPTYDPSAPYRTTLEVPQGWFARVGVGEGDTARLVSGG